MSHRHTLRLIGAAAVGVCLTVSGQSSFADDPTFQPDATVGPTEVDLAGSSDRVRLTTADGAGHTLLEAVPRPDGTTPGLLVTTAGGATTVQATDTDEVPTLVAGTTPLQAAADPDDLVELRFEAIGRDGRPALAHVNIFDTATGAVSRYRRLPGDPGAECTSAPSSAAACILVPRGTYSLMGLVTTMPMDQPSTANRLSAQSLSLVGDPEVSVFRDRTVVLDARKANKLDVRTPGVRTKINSGGTLELGYTRTAANGQSIDVAVQPTMLLDPSVYMQPTADVRLGSLQSLTRLRLEAPDIELTAPRTGALHPQYYDRVWFSDTTSQFPVYDGRASLRVVDVGHATADDLAGLDLHGALAVAERCDDIPVADQSNGAAEAGAEAVVVYNDAPGDNSDPGLTGTLLEVPTLRLSRAEALTLLDLRPPDRVTMRGESVTPYVYDLVLTEDHGIPDDLTYTLRSGARGNLATQVRAFHGQPTQDSTFSEAAYPWRPGDTFSLSRMFPVRGGAQTRTEHRIADPATRWRFATTTPELRYNALFPHQPVLPMSLVDPELTSYAPGERVTKAAGAAPVTAGLNPARPIARSGDRMRVDVSGFVDADGSSGASYTDASGMRTLLQITAGGVVVAETTHLPSGIAQLPAGEQRVTVAFTAENPQPWTELSTRTETRWTFDSPPVAEGEARVQPAITADYDVDVDLRNRVRGPVFDLFLAHLDGASPASIDDVTVQASYDGGASWQPASVAPVADGQHRVVLPRGRGPVSLKLHAADAVGSELDQTIIGAWYVR